VNDKTAIVIDTNFIIAHIKDLRDVHQKLSESYDVYVTDISIQERLSQRYLELRAKYDKIEKFRSEYANLVNIGLKRTFEEQYDAEARSIRNNYSSLLNNNIIPFAPDADMLKTVMDRVYMKTPPFVSGDSDRGFKDTLLWLSLLGYFKENGSDAVGFITNDKGFRNNTDALCKEFNEYTGKAIEIHGNDFYDDFIKPSDSPNAITPEPLPDVSLLRERIQETISALCFGEYETGSWGEPVWVRTFAVRKKVTAEDIAAMFDKLHGVVAGNLFETDILPTVVFAFDNIEDTFPMPMSVLQSALHLYEELYSKFQTYLPQFFSATANIFNKNYQEVIKPFEIPDDDDDLPF
jgi:hypothetical protein